MRLEEPGQSLDHAGQHLTAEAEVFRTHAPPHGVCDNLINALELLANQQPGGDSLAEALVGCLQERRRLKMMDELRRFIMVDNHEADKTGDLEKALESLSVVEPKLIAEFPEAVVREGADELTLLR